MIYQIKRFETVMQDWWFIEVYTQSCKKKILTFQFEKRNQLWMNCLNMELWLILNSSSEWGH